MNKLYDWLANHFYTVRICTVLLLLLAAAGLIWYPSLIVSILRYGFAAVNIFLALNLVINMIRRGRG